MADTCNLEALEIVGYAETLSAGMLPTVVAPVFRCVDDLAKYFLPPFHIHQGLLCGAACLSPDEVEALVDDHRITLLNAPFPARSGYELWIDQDLHARYQPAEEAELALKEIASTHIREADAALKAGNLEQAARLAAIALSADDRRIEPLAIRAAVFRLRKEETGVSVLQRMAQHALEPRLFQMLVNDYCRPTPATAPSPAARHPMRGTAELRPAYA